MARYTVLFDACVLYPAPLRDFLIELATANLFRAKWTDRIHDEWTRSLLEKRPDLDGSRLARTRQRMNAAIPDSLVVGYEHLIPAVRLPDEKDRHVVAAAFHARADAIVTFNLKDFPSTALAPLGLEAIHPDEFIVNQFDLDEPKVVSAAAECCARLLNPPKTGAQYLDTMRAQGLPKTIALLRQYEQLLSPSRASPE